VERLVAQLASRIVIDDSLDWYLDNLVVPGLATSAAALVRKRRWLVAVHAAERRPELRAALTLARAQGLVLTRRQALSAGLDAAAVRRLVRRGSWTAPRRNVLCVLPRPGSGPQNEPHGLRAEMFATAAVLVRPASVISHESAAAIHGMPLLHVATRPVLTAIEGNGGGRRDVLVHLAALSDDEIRIWFGCPVTSVARTVVDLARNLGVSAGLVAADAALHDELVTRAELGAALARAVRWPGVTTARRVVELASPLAESPLESLSRLMIVDGGLPVPELQVRVHTERGTYRVDGLWRERRVVLEVDGMLKYRTVDDLREEKLRQEALERAGYLVVRVTWDDVVRQPVRTSARITRTLWRGATA
jgi:very-short-patch-repair endonuclease